MKYSEQNKPTKQNKQNKQMDGQTETKAKTKLLKFVCFKFFFQTIYSAGLCENVQ